MEGLKNLGSGMRSGYSETPMQPEVNVPAGEHDVPVRRHAGPTKMQHLGNLLGKLIRGASDAAPGGTFGEGFELAGRMPLERALRRKQDLEARERTRRSRVEFEDSQKPRPMGEPVTLQRGGKPVLVQRYSDGSLRPVEGYEPADKTAGKAQLPDFIQSGPFAGHMLDAETGMMKAATVDFPLTVPDTSAMQLPPARSLTQQLEGGAMLPSFPDKTVQVPISVPSILEEQRRAPTAAIRTQRDAGGTSEDVVVDRNPQSPTFGQVVARPGVTREPLPPKSRGPSASDKSRADVKAAESLATQAYAEANGDVDAALARIEKGLQEKLIDPALASRIRKSLNERRPKHKGKPSRRERLDQMAMPPPATGSVPIGPPGPAGELR